MANGRVRVTLADPSHTFTHALLCFVLAQLTEGWPSFVCLWAGVVLLVLALLPRFNRS